MDNKFHQEISFCNHIKDISPNAYVDNQTDNQKLKNFFCLNRSSSKSRMKHDVNSYFIKNISQEWIALGNPNNLSFTSLKKEGLVFDLNFNSIGTKMVVSNYKHNHQIEVWDMREKKLWRTLTEHTHVVTGMEYFHNDDSRMLTFGMDKTIKLWEDYRCVNTLTEHNDWLKCVALTKDNREFISGCKQGVIKLWDVTTCKVINSIANPFEPFEMFNTVNGLSFMTADDNVFVCGLLNGTVKIFDKRFRTDINLNGIGTGFKAHRSKLNTVKNSKSCSYLMTCGRDSAIRLWDYRKLPVGNTVNNNIKSAVSEFNSHECSRHNIESNFFCGDNYILTGSENSYVYLYDINKKEPIKTFKTDMQYVNVVKPLPDCAPYSFAYTGLENISVFICSMKGVLGKEIEKAYAMKRNEKMDNGNEGMDKETNKKEDLTFADALMSECGEVILNMLHSNNLTNSSEIDINNIFNILLFKNVTEGMMRMQKLSNYLTKKTENFAKDTQPRKVLCQHCKRSEWKVEDADYPKDIDESFHLPQHILEMPNKFNSFSNVAMRAHDIPTNIKTVYSSENYYHNQ